IEEMRAQISDLEGLLSCHAEETKELRAQLSATQDQLCQSMQIVAEEQSQAQKRKELLDCTSISPSWQLSAQPWSLWKQGLLVWKRQTGRKFRGILEMPAEDFNIRDYLEISGWAYSTEAPIRLVGAFLDNVPLGLMKYG